MVPLTVWIGFFVAMYAVMFALTSLLYRQWAERERLTFPIVFAPIAMAEAPRPGHRVNDFLGNWMTWLGALVPIVIFAWNGLKSYVPALPR